MSSGSEVVTLKGGLTVPVDAYCFALTLEARGVHLEGAGADLLAWPRELLTDDDRRTIQALKPHLRRLVDYRAPEVA